MGATLNQSEETQLRQTIEMFEVITQSQPLDYQSLEILKEAYLKLGWEKEIQRTSNRIAQAYVQLGQLSSAILEYETILQRNPDDPEALAAMAQIENRANNLTSSAEGDSYFKQPSSSAASKVLARSSANPAEIDDGRQSMSRLFVEGKMMTAGDFQLCWQTPGPEPPARPVEPFIYRLADKGIIPIEKSLRLLSDRARMAFFYLEKYDVDVELAKKFPRETCLRWCILPFDHMGKAVMVATSNPFNKQAVAEIEQDTKHRVLWYLAAPAELLNALSKIYR